MRKRIWVGVSGAERVVFLSAEAPTDSSHGWRYGAVVGPFRTRAGAEACAAGAPYGCVADFDRLAQRVNR